MFIAFVNLLMIFVALAAVVLVVKYFKNKVPFSFHYKICTQRNRLHLRKYLQIVPIASKIFFTQSMNARML